MSVLGLLLLLAAAAEVQVPGPAGVLAGTLTLPGGEGPFPAVVAVTGSGPHLRDGNRTPGHPYRPFQQIAEHLASCGVATLRLDDRGAGASAGDAAGATLEDTADDTRAALRFLGRHPAIDGRRLALLGHSYGGIVAPLVAAGEGGLAALVLLGAPAHSFRETMRYQHRWRLERDATIAPGDRDRELARAMREQDANVAASTEAWRRSIQDRDPLPTAARLRLPVLILQGLNDSAVDPGDARILERTLRGAGNARVSLRLFAGVNHHFQRDPVGARQGYDDLPTQDLAPEVLEELCSWLGSILRGAGPRPPGERSARPAKWTGPAGARC